MFQLYADKTKLTVRAREPITSGSVGTYTVQFQFSADWDELSKTAVFRSGQTSVSVLLDLVDDAGECTIPWEVMQSHGTSLLVGIYGTKGGDIVLPTIWASLGMVLEGAALGEDVREPTPGVYDKVLAELAEVRDILQSMGGSGGTSDRRLLSGREAGEQHPITAIQGLVRELERIPAPVECLTNQDLEELLK